MNPTVFASIVAAAIVVCVLAILALVYLLLRVRLESLLQRRLDPQAHAVARDFGVAGTAPMIETMARSGKAIEQMIDTEGESRSEEHTSEFQSLMRISYAVFCLKKKTKNRTQIT